MKLQPNELLSGVPPLGSQRELEPGDRIIHKVLKIPALHWRWFVAEGDASGKSDAVFFGYVIGDSQEWAEFRLQELAEVNKKVEEMSGTFDMHGLAVEVDKNFRPARFSELEG